MLGGAWWPLYIYIYVYIIFVRFGLVLSLKVLGSDRTWRCKGPGEAVSTGTGETPRSRETLVQRRQAHVFLCLRRRSTAFPFDVGLSPPSSMALRIIDRSLPQSFC